MLAIGDMFRRGLAAAAILGVAAFVSRDVIAADEMPIEPRLILPGDEPSPTLRLGFYGHVAPGYGMVVDRVPHGGLASRIGLEPGDVIVRVNGWRIRSEGDYIAALARTGRYLRLGVFDVRGRGTVNVTYDLSRPDPSEPRPYFAPEPGTVYRPVLPERR